MKTPGPPSTIQLGPYTIEVKQSNRPAKTAWGNYNVSTYVMTMQKEWPNPGKCLEVLIHELLHACWHSACLEDKEKEEIVVTRLAVWLAMAFRDNPLLVEWFSIMSKEK